MTTDNNKDNLYHSEELKDIINKIPSNFNRIILIGLLFLILILFCIGVVIKIPGQIDIPAKIISNDPPIVLKSHLSGKITLLIDTFPLNCKKNEVIAVINNPALTDDVFQLKNMLQKIEPNIYDDENLIDSLFTKRLSLGTIENNFTIFREKLQIYYSLKDNSVYQYQIEHKVRSINNNKTILLAKKQILNNSLSENSVYEKRYKTDSLLYNKGIIIKDDYSNSLLQNLSSKNYTENLKIDIANVEMELKRLALELDKLNVDYSRDLRSARFSIAEAYGNLLSSIKIWEDSYVFICHRDSYVELVNVISTGDFVVESQPLFHLVFDGSNYYCVAMLPPFGAGEVKIGQIVNIKLDLYPYQEYGVLKGIVSSITRNSIENYYLVQINLPQNLLSSNGVNLFFAESMTGKAEIITEDKRLIEALFYKFLNTVKSNKKDIHETEEK